MSCWYPTAKMARSKPCRRSCRSNSSRNGRPATSAIPLGAFPRTLRNRRPAPPHSNTTSAVLGIDRVPLGDQRFVIHLVWLIDHDVTTFIREGKRNAQQLLQPLP